MAKLRLLKRSDNAVRSATASNTCTRMAIKDKFVRRPSLSLGELELEYASTISDGHCQGLPNGIYDESSAK